MGLIVLTFFYIVAVYTVFLDYPFLWLPLRFSVAFIDNYSNIKLTLENTEGSNKNEHSSETCNIEYTRRRQTKQKHNTIYVGHHYAQTNTNNINKTWALLQRTGDKDEPNIVLCRNRNGHHWHCTGIIIVLLYVYITITFAWYDFFHERTTVTADEFS